MKKTTDLSGTSKGYKVFSVAILVVMVIFFLFPLYWIVTGSFKNKLEITARTPIWFPIEPTVENYARLFDNPAFLWLFNIIFISAGAMILTCLTASLAGYALGKKRFIGRGVLFTIIICAMALPKQVIVIPLAQEMTNFFHLNDTLWAVILPTVGWPFGVFLMKQFSETIPTEILEAARVDGASRFQVFYKVIMPLSKPIVIYTVLTAFMAPWGDFMFAKYISHNTEVGMNVAVGLQYWISSKTLIATNYTMFCAGGVVVALPVTILFMLLQRYYVEGVTGGAVKG